MSEFLADARVLIRPDTTGFRALLQEQVNRAISQTQVAALQIPIAVGGSALAAAASSTAALAAQQRATEKTTLGLASAAQVENTAFGRQAVILTAATRATAQKAGADAAATAAAHSHAVAQGQVGKAAIASTAGMLGLRGAVLTAGTAFIAATVGFQALGKAVGSAISFERELNVFQVTAGATADQMERVTLVARELGRDITLPGVAANDAAQALSLLARAGLTVEDSLNAVRGTLQLATAAQIDNASAAELVANALNSFKLDGTEAVRVADLLAGAANESQGSITDMGLALRQTSAIASGLGISIEATVTILTQLSRAGLSASDAGTSFRQTLLRLIQDLPKVNKEVERLGLDLRDMNGNIRPEVFEELGRKLQKLTPAARQLAIANLGGADAIRTLLILTRAQAGEFDAVQASVTQAGLAQEFAAAQTKGLGGDVEAAKNQFADLGLTVGKVASGPLSLLVRTAGAAAGAINEINRSVEESTGGGGFLRQFGLVINDFAGSFARLNFQMQQGVRQAALGRTEFSGFTAVMRGAAEATDALADALERAGKNTISKQGIPATGINVKQVLNRVAGFDAEEVRARISGDTNSLLSVLETEQQFLIDQLDRQFVKNRPALRRALENALLGVTNDISSITRQGATDVKSAADDAARAQRDSDEALLSLLSNRRDDVQRKIAAAAETEGLQDDIRSQIRLQALIKQQIRKIRDRIKDEQARKAAIRELRLALISSRAEEDALRAQQRADAQARIDTVQELNIAIAQETGNDAALARAINARITRLNKQIKAAKGDQVKVKELILERERLKNQLDELTEQEKETGKSARDAAAAFFFEQLQAQQGFASNLMGNLITGPTAGLVGVPSPTTPGRGIATAAAVQEGKRDGGPTSGQANSQLSVLEKILMQLRILNGSYDAPEAINQKKAGGASMDYATM